MVSKDKSKGRKRRFQPGQRERDRARGVSDFELCKLVIFFLWS